MASSMVRLTFLVFIAIAIVSTTAQPKLNASKQLALDIETNTLHSLLLPPPMIPPPPPHLSRRLRLKGHKLVERRTIQKREMRDDFESDLAEREEFIPSTKVDLDQVESFDQESVDLEGSGENSLAVSSKPSLPFEPSSVVTLHPEAGYRDDATYPKTSAAVPRIRTSIATDPTLAPKYVSEDAESNHVLPEEKMGSVLVQPEVEKKEEEDDSIFLPILPTDPPIPDEPLVKISGDGLFSWIIETMIENDKVEVSYDLSDSASTAPPAREVQSFDATSSSRPLFSATAILVFMKKNTALIVGGLLVIPATVVLCYFIYLSYRRRRYMGSLNVSSSSIYPVNKKRPAPERPALLSEENELSSSPTGKAFGAGLNSTCQSPCSSMLPETINKQENPPLPPPLPNKEMP